ncbi:CvpA family protein [Acetivibrio mesophilus]|uniref:CvpA family protein n=1 Tax=Acetivibrio mesophilus TaxID=2487273 RepID=A0A4Q0I6E2_9FIRM|nr:CvpA family protein [Acetivibrio mesophilus]ODM27507.1 colicin V production protein [Clostridium sp. Bc-iso-3]RXE59467.1 CvpA family protein [Acetivibrio mesophilus]HHV30258.1 CvpA family protein [Clostridium sp.]
MNWIDLVVIGIILGLALIGMKKGIVYSVFKLASFFISAVLSVKLYPIIAKALSGTKIFDSIKSGIFNNLMLRQEAMSPSINDGAKATAQSVIDGLSLPGFMKDMMQNSIVKSLPNVTELIDVSTIMDSLSGLLAYMIIDIISLIVMFIVIRIGLFILERVIKGVTKLPIIKQADKIGGFTFGALEGLLTVCIVFAILMMFSSSPKFQGVFDAIEHSTVAKVLYQNNFIVDWMFPKNTIV